MICVFTERQRRRLDSFPEQYSRIVLGYVPACYLDDSPASGINDDISLITRHILQRLIAIQISLMSALTYVFFVCLIDPH